jgi:dTDP-4-dehydrorhamnose reductase
MKIFVTGVNGQVGSALVRQAKELGHEVIAISRLQWDMAQSPMQGKELVLQLKPDLVINPAAYTNVDGAEGDESTARKVNANAPRALAKACKQLGIPLFHVSTDYVFDGSKEEPYVETDQTNPINVYGCTKLAGELALQEETDKFLILRTSWVFSKEGHNFVNTILRLAEERDELKVVDDQLGGPTNAECIAKVLLKLTVGHKEQWGIYHYSGQPFVSWFEFAKSILQQNIDGGADSKAPEIKPCKSDEFFFKAKRPKNSRLSQQKLERVYGQVPCDWHEALSRGS